MNKDSTEEPYQKLCRSRKSIILNNFLGGIAWSLGEIIKTAHLEETLLVK